MPEQIEIRRSPVGNTSLIVLCVLAVAVCAFMLYVGSLTQGERVIMAIGIIFFGGSGIFAVTQIQKPVVVISDEGITAPFLWHENFVSWEDVERFEVVTQTVRTTRVSYVGVFAPNARGIVGADGAWKYITKASTGWAEVPTLIVNTSFTCICPDEVVGILQEFHNEHKIAQGLEIKVPLSDEELLSQGIEIEVPPSNRSSVSPRHRVARVSKADRKEWDRPTDYYEDLFVMSD